MRKENLLAISIRQPWAWAILRGWKKVENRSWKPPDKVVGNQVLVHAGKAKENAADWVYVEEILEAFHSEEIERIVRLHAKSDAILNLPFHKKVRYLYSLDGGNAAARGGVLGAVRITGWRDIGYSIEEIRESKEGEQWDFGPIVWDLKDPEIFHPMLPAKGALGFFHPTPDTCGEDK